MVKHRILLADDSVTIQKVVNLTFADEGIEVVAVGDGDAAMQRFVESTPDLVMVDVNMPGVDGYRICEMIKQDDETKHIPVILLVGSFEPFDEDEARRVGADDFLTKPFQSIRQLVNKVSDLLNGKRNSAFDGEKVAGSFDDTLEMLPPVEEAKTAEYYGDSAMDDEMIQTNQIGSLPVNEAQKFESAPKTDDSNEDENSEIEFVASDEETNFENESIDEADKEETFEIESNDEPEKEENFGTESTDEESKEILTEENLPETELHPEENPEEISEGSIVSDDLEETVDDDDDEEEPLPRHENIYEFANEQEYSAEENSASTAETQEIKYDLTDEVEEENSDNAEDILLENVNREDNSQENNVEEISVVEPKTNQSEESETPAKFEATQEFALDDFDLLELPRSEKSKVSETNVSEMQNFKITLSPEDIEAIAARVIERLSGDVVKEIVREVVSQTIKEK